MGKRFKSQLTYYAKKLRRDQTIHEKILWKRLKSRQLNNYKIRRQQPIGPYIVDFVCFERKIVIELDGSHHLSIKKEDSKRDDWLISQGFTVLRFWNSEITTNLDNVLLTILEHCCSHPPHPLPSREG